MKKVINEKLYDTETSERLFENSYDGRIIYRTTNNGYFLVSPSGQFSLLTEDGAKRIIGNNDADLYIKLWNVKEG